MDICHLNKKTIVLLLLSILCSASFVKANNDLVLPATVNMQSDYILSDSLVTVDDTLTITRTVINNEVTPLTCFYFCENLPNNFSIISHTVNINELSVIYDYTTPTASSAFTDYTEYYFVLDYPGIDGTYDLLIQPNDTVVVEYKIVCSSVGQYDLPLHTFIGHNGTTGIFGFSDSLQVRFDVSLDVDDNQNLPNSFSLEQNYPNPFNPSTTIEFSIPEKSEVRIEIYNMLGQSVRTLLIETLTAGNHLVEWDGLVNNGNTAPSGIYLYKLSTTNRALSKKMLLLK